MGLLNQMSQNLANTGQNTDNPISSSGLNIDLGLGIGGGNGSHPTPPTDGTPTTFRQLLSDLTNEQVQVTTPFGAVTGILLVVKNDYIVVIENSGEQVLINIDKIELISEL